MTMINLPKWFYRRSLDRDILRLSIPAVVSNITVPLLGLSDTAIAGHLGSPLFLGAMGVGATMINLSFWLFGFLRAGTTGLTAQAWGRGDAAGVSGVFCRAIVLAALIGLWLVVLRYPLSDFLTGVIAPEPAVRDLAREYYRICILAAPAQLCIMVMSGWMVGMQSTLWPMVVAIVTNAVNIPLSFSLVFGAGMGFEGIAAGTVAAQWTGVLVALLAVRHMWKLSFGRASVRRGTSLLAGMRALLHTGGMKGFFSVNSNLFVRSGFIMAVTVAMTAYGGRIGPLALAVNAVMMQMFLFFSFFADGVAYAAEAMAGSLAGAGRWKALRFTAARILYWGGVLAVVFTLVYFIGGSPLARLLTESPDVRTALADMRWWYAAIPAVSILAFLFDGFYIGLTHTGSMLAVTALSAALFFGIMLARPEGPLTNPRLWFAFLAYLLLRGLLLASLFPRTLHLMTKSR